MMSTGSLFSDPKTDRRAFGGLIQTGSKSHRNSHVWKKTRVFRVAQCVQVRTSHFVCTERASATQLNQKKMGSYTIEEIHVRNIKPFGQGMTWDLTQSAKPPADERNQPYILYCKTPYDGSENPSIGLLDLVRLAVGSEPSRKIGDTMRQYEYEQGEEAAIIVKLKYSTTKSKATLYQGLFRSDGGVYYQFLLDHREKQFSLHFANERSVKWCTTPERKRDKPFKKYDNIFSELQHCSLEGKNYETSPRKPIQIPADVLSNLTHYDLPNKDFESPFMPYLRVLEGEGRPRIVHQEDDDANLTESTTHQLAYYQKLQNLCQSASMKGGILVMGMHDINNYDPDRRFIEELNKISSELQQVIIITDCPYLCEDNYFQRMSEMKYLYTDRCKIHLSVAPFFMGNQSSISTYQWLHSQIDSTVILSEMILLVEGEEDKKLVEQWIKAFLKLFKTSLGNSDLVSCLNYPFDIKEWEPNKKCYFTRMLQGLEVVSLEGKDNFCEAITHFCMISTPHCMVMDIDAMFKLEAEGQAKQIGKIQSDAHPRVRWDFNIKEKELLWEDSAAFNVIKCVLKKIQLEIVQEQYANVYGRVRNDWLSKHHKITEVEECVRNIFHEESLTAISLFEKYQRLFRLFVWRNGNGTSSGAMGMKKKEVKKMKGTRVDSVTLSQIQNDPKAKYELERFLSFLCHNVFRHYIAHNERRFGPSSEDARTTAPKAKVEVTKGAVKVKAEAKIMEGSLVTEDEVESVNRHHCEQAAEHLNNLHMHKRTTAYAVTSPAKIEHVSENGGHVFRLNSLSALSTDVAPGDTDSDSSSAITDLENRTPDDDITTALKRFAISNEKGPSLLEEKQTVLQLCTETQESENNVGLYESQN